MKLSSNPRTLCISDPDFASKPYPYVFGCVPSKIESLGFPVAHLNPSQTTFESFKDSINKFRPDLIFCFIQQPPQQKKIADFLDEYHPVPAINWSLEDPNFVTRSYFNSEYTMIDISASFDMWFCNDSKMVPFWKTKAAFMPPGFDESVYYDFKIDRVFDVSYVGYLSFENAKIYWPYIQVLASYRKKAAICTNRPMGIPIFPKPIERLLGSSKMRHFLQSLPFWQCHWENPKNEHEKALLVNKSKIHFGMNRVLGDWEKPLMDLIPDYPLDKHGLFYQLKGRVFHAVGAGAMALNEYCPELEDFFDIGKEIITFEFGEVDDLKEKLSWYLAHDNEREKVARAGYERGRKQHTFTARINQILDIIKKTL
jgi:spore maturation protein CgeB